jgi:hypothetical protein
MVAEQFPVELHEVCNVAGRGTLVLKHVLICGSGCTGYRLMSDQ